jgi:HEPN domain-containing protein
VTNLDLARSYLRKAEDRLVVLEVLQQRGAYSDVVREAQELVELALKGMLRAVAVEPPKFHDVSALLLEHAARFRPDVASEIRRLCEISKRLRKERELAFYGDIDFIPTEEYSPEDGARALDEARVVVAAAQKTIGR